MNNHGVLLLGAIGFWLAAHWVQPISVPVIGSRANGSELSPDLPFEVLIDYPVPWPKFQEMCFGLCTDEEGQ